MADVSTFVVPVNLSSSRNSCSYSSSSSNCNSNSNSISMYGGRSSSSSRRRIRKSRSGSRTRSGRRRSSCSLLLSLTTGTKDKSSECNFSEQVFKSFILINGLNYLPISVESATPGEEVLGSIPSVATLLVGSVSVECDRLRQKPWSPHSVSCVAALAIVRCQSWSPSAI